MRSYLTYLLVSALFPLTNGVATADDFTRTITVQGEGTAAARPDMATIQTGVTTTAETAKAALDANNKAMQQVMQEIKAKNIDDKDIQTSGFHVHPEYRREPRESSSNQIEAYRVSNTLTIKVRNLARLGEILDALVQAGSNQLSGVSFSIADSRAVMNDARKKAVDDARGRAELYASAMNVKVGKVLSVSEQTIQSPQPYQARMMAESAGSVPIATGEQEVTATINVQYELVD